MCGSQVEMVEVSSVDITAGVEGRKCRVMSSGSFMSPFDLHNDFHLGSFIVCPVLCRLSGTGNGVVVPEHHHLFCHLSIGIIMFHLSILLF